MHILNAKFLVKKERTDTSKYIIRLGTKNYNFSGVKLLEKKIDKGNGEWDNRGCPSKIIETVDKQKPNS